MEKLVEIRDICKVYNPGENEVKALDHVSLTFKEGEFVAIIGHSGSGKSTLMNMLGCLDVPTSGSYFLHGHDVGGMSDDELSDIRNQEIGFIFQGFNLIPSLTAVENVELPLIYRGVGKKEWQELSEKALEKVGLGQRMTHKPAEMSGGQQQRVAIARAIAQAQPIILADEPTGNLDSGSTREIIDILRGLHEEGRTVILLGINDSELTNLHIEEVHENAFTVYSYQTDAKILNFSITSNSFWMEEYESEEMKTDESTDFMKPIDETQNYKSARKALDMMYGDEWTDALAWYYCQSIPGGYLRNDKYAYIFVDDKGEYLWFSYRYGATYPCRIRTWLFKLFTDNLESVKERGTYERLLGVKIEDHLIELDIETGKVISDN